MTARARRTTATTTLVAMTHPSTIAMLVTKARKAMGVGMARLLKGRTVAIRAWTGQTKKRTRSDDDDDVGCYVCRQERHNKMWSVFVARSTKSKMLMHNVPYNDLCINWMPIRRCLANHLQNGWRSGGCLVYGTCAWPVLVLVLPFYLSPIPCPKDFFRVSSSDSLRLTRS